MIEITPDVHIDESELTWHFVRGSGPGGQNVNKVATTAQLRWDAMGSQGLPPAVKERLARLAGQRLNTEPGAQSPGSARPAGEVGPPRGLAPETPTSVTTLKISQSPSIRKQKTACIQETPAPFRSAAGLGLAAKRLIWAPGPGWRLLVLAASLAYAG